MNDIVLETNFEGLLGPKRINKVRDVYIAREYVVIIATDRVSAFDKNMQGGIPDRGAILTQMSKWWARRVLSVPTAFELELQATDFGLPEEFNCRTTIMRRAIPLPIESIVRGYITGSAWKAYQKGEKICGLTLPAGLKESAKFPEPIWTPSTKAEIGGKDENISFIEAAGLVGGEEASYIAIVSCELYVQAAQLARQRGYILADTKFEFGLLNGQIVLIDELFTPDSSRYWSADTYAPGGPQESVDKQILRDWLESKGWDKISQPPSMPREIIAKMQQSYLQVFEDITGQQLVR